MGCLSFLQGIFSTQRLNLLSCFAGRLFTIWATKEALDSTNKVVLNILVQLIHIIFSFFWVMTRNSPGSKLLSHREDISLIVQEIVKQFPKVVELEFQLFHIYVSIWCCRPLVVAILEVWMGFPACLYSKEFICMQEAEVQSLGWEDPLEKEMATHSSTLAWRIPWTEESDGLQVIGLKSWTRLSNSHTLRSVMVSHCCLNFHFISLTNHVEHIFMHLLLIHIPFLVKCPLKYFAHVKYIYNVSAVQHSDSVFKLYFSEK